MKRIRISSYWGLWVLGALILPTTTVSQTIAGRSFDSVMAAQNLPLQLMLASLFPEDSGYVVSGPLDPLFRGDSVSTMLYRSLRVTCPSVSAVDDALTLIKQSEHLTVLRWFSHLHMARDEMPYGYRGVMAVVSFNGKTAYLQLLTLNQTRWLIWAHDILSSDPNRQVSLEQWGGLARAASEHFYAIDQRWSDPPLPMPKLFGLPDSLGIYRFPNAAGISRRELDDLLRKGGTIQSDFAMGITAFYASDSLFDRLGSTAPTVAYRNRNRGIIQQELGTFLSRGGSMISVRTLTKELFQRLEAGEYIFGVSPAGMIRYFRNPSDAEIEEFEWSVGRKMPLAAESFLFPGEAILAAGRFVVKHDSVPRIVEINCYSDHYYFSSFDPGLKDEILRRSDRYLLSLGYFFKSFDNLDIPYRSALIRKFPSPPSDPKIPLAR